MRKRHNQSSSSFSRSTGASRPRKRAGKRRRRSSQQLADLIQGERNETPDSGNVVRKKVGSNESSLFDNLFASPVSTSAADTVDKNANPSKSRETEIQSHYQTQTRRPIICLIFVLPLIIAYEIGALLPGSDALRSGIDLWIDSMLMSIGMGHLVILPVLTATVLVGWHHYQKDDWRFSPSTLWGMLVESLGLGMILFWVASAYYQLVHQCQPDTSLMLPMMGENPQWSAASIVSLGSGIYEELVFRLMMLIPVAWLLKTWVPNQRVATGCSMILVSLLFAAMHYNLFNPGGVELDIGSFAFRFVASMFFCFLFFLRGFGIAVGTHVTYDVLTQM